MALQRAVKIHGENIGRSLRKRYTQAGEPSWEETGQQFHLRHRPERFTEQHAQEAKYRRRNPAYTKRKFQKFGHRNPLEYSGEVRRLTASARIQTRKGTGQVGNKGGVKVSYRGARKLNLKNPSSKINMVEEFTIVTDREAKLLGTFFQSRFESRFYTRG